METDAEYLAISKAREDPQREFCCNEQGDIGQPTRMDEMVVVGEDGVKIETEEVPAETTGKEN